MTFNVIVFSLVFCITIIPIFYIKNRFELKKSQKQNLIYTIIWMFTSLIISFLILILTKTKLSYETLIPTSIFGSILNYFILNEQINTKTVTKTLIIFLCFFFSSLLQYIPITLFNIKNITINTQVLLTCFSDSCLIFLLLKVYYKELKEEFIVFRKNFNEYIDTAFKYYFIGLLVMVVSNVIINFLTPTNMASNEESIQKMIEASPYLTLICTAFFAPVIEELIFRKSFSKAFNNKYLFIIISGLVFGGLHVVLSIRGWYDLLYLIPYCSLGFSFAIIYSKYDNIFPTITIHALHNAIITIISIISFMVIL